MSSDLSNRSAKRLVILLHGVGSSGAAMAPIAEYLGARFSNLAIATPDGPFPSDIGVGRQWFSIKDVTEANRLGRVKQAMPSFRSVINEARNFHAISEGSTLLIGFSQGTIMSLEHIAAGGGAAGVIGLSGRLAASPSQSLPSSPSVKLIHGADDPVIPVSMARQSLDWLRDAGVKADLTVLDRLGHSIDQRVLDEIGAHVAEFCDRQPILEAT